MLGGVRGFVLVLCLSGLSSWHVRAQDTSAGSPPPSFGIVDQQRVMATSQAARMVLEQRNAYLDRYQSQAAQQEKVFREEERKLLSARKTLSVEEYARFQSAFHVKVSRFQGNAQDQRQRLEQSFSEAMAEVRAVLIQVADEVAHERGCARFFIVLRCFFSIPSLILRRTF